MAKIEIKPGQPRQTWSDMPPVAAKRRRACTVRLSDAGRAHLDALPAAEVARLRAANARGALVNVRQTAVPDLFSALEETA